VRRSRQKNRYLLPLIAAIGIGALLMGTIVALLPEGGFGSGGDSAGNGSQVQVTPGGEEERLTARLQQNPDDVDAMLTLADLMSNTGRGTDAIHWYEEAVQRRPDDAEIRTSFGVTLQRYNHPLDAELQLKKARELAPTDPEPAYYLGIGYAQAQPPRTDEARAAFQAAIDAAPDSVYADLAKQQLDQLDKK
jgi:Tfp pilus assembly protein PilF